ncbi:haloacid dehalogenase-like hydrolase domain-containing 5 [Saccostrea cucullata]|uniref:haloacid dehalogenase-like hydrolase domain-containing 5 n=1 Tax=Saccostrea cuccullata TaxID=36930 RepID=UPI002ED654C6
MAFSGRILVKSLNLGDLLSGKVSTNICKRMFRRHINHKSNRGHDFGFLFDIDGVIKRGKRILPSAREAFQLLTDESGKFRLPVVFVTNAGNTFRQTKADELSELLGIKISTEQLVMSHSPLKMFKRFHNMHTLICGQGPIEGIARDLGFTNITTVDQLRELFPYLDMVDHSHRKVEPCPVKFANFKPIEAVVLFGEPNQWDSKLQLIVDVLVCNGMPSHLPKEFPSTHLPIVACNMDLFWMAEVPIPRFGHGMFLTFLETAYQQYTGRELKYSALLGKPSLFTYHYADNVLWKHAKQLGFRSLKSIYCVGDNPNTDIYGANVYDRYLKKRKAHKVQKKMKRKMAAGGGGADFEFEDDDEELVSEEGGQGNYSTSCSSILVCTGIFSNSHTASHRNHRDFVLDPELVKPKHTTENVFDAVRLTLEKEKFL